MVTILLVLMTNWLICLPSISYDLRLNLSVTRLMHMTCMLQLEREPYNPSHVHIIISCRYRLGLEVAISIYCN